MDIAVLTEELRTDPASIGYAGRSAQAVADALNTPRAASGTLRKLQPVEIMDTVGAIAYKALLTNARSTTPATAATANLVISYMQSAGDEGLSIAVGSPFRDALLAAGITTELGLALLALATVERSRGEELGLGVVGDGHVRSCEGTEWWVSD